MSECSSSRFSALDVAASGSDVRWFLGSTQLPPGLALPPGRYQFVARREGFVDQTIVVDVGSEPFVRPKPGPWKAFGDWSPAPRNESTKDE